MFNEMNYSQDVLIKFWKRVNVPEDWKEYPKKCWMWIGAIHKTKKYGNFCIITGKTIGAHRFSYELYNGSIQSSSLLVCHTCDEPSCVNPNHLFLGTSKDNVDDAIRKNRFTIGSKNGMAKLTEYIILDMLNKIDQGLLTSVVQICSIYGVHETMIRGILKGKYWKSLKLDNQYLTRIENKIVRKIY